MPRRLALVFVLSMAAACASRGPGTAATPVAGTVDVQVLAFNDFHGSLAPPAGSNGRVGTTDAGGVEYLETHLKQLAATNPNTLIVSAGDNIGATPILSGMFHDEPTIEGLNALGLQYSAVGNHELDEGWAELYRMQNGGCHPVDGCQDGTPFAGARFKFLTANIVLDPMKVDAKLLVQTGWRNPSPGPQPLFSPYAVEQIGGVKIGLIGLTLQGAPEIVSPLGLAGLTFLPEAQAANNTARMLRAQGVNTIVVLIHEGGTPPTETDPNGCDIRGPIVQIAQDMSSDIDVVVSGHTHKPYVCTLNGKLVTSAFSLSRLITDIDLTIDRASGRVMTKTARNVIVTRDVPKAADETAIVNHYAPFAATIADRPMGTAVGPISRLANEAGESALGDLVADAMLEAARAAGHDLAFAFTNPGGIRNDLVPTPAAGGGPGTVTYGQVFEVLPFANIIVIRTMTGAQILQLLEQQWQASRPSVLQISSGVTYTWDASQPVGSRIVRDSVMIEGKPLVPTLRYRVASNDFIWGGGDSFSVATEATEPVAVKTDIEVFGDYLAKHSPLGPGPQNRISRRP